MKIKCAAGAIRTPVLLVTKSSILPTELRGFQRGDSYRESYMSVHILINLLNEFRKRKTIRACQSLLHSEFNEFINS